MFILISDFYSNFVQVCKYILCTAKNSKTNKR